MSYLCLRASLLLFVAVALVEQLLRHFILAPASLQNHYIVTACPTQFQTKQLARLTSFNSTVCIRSSAAEFLSLHSASIFSRANMTT